MNGKQGEALKAAIEAAVSTPDVLKAIARACWFDARKKGERLQTETNCPAYLIPTGADMQAWLDKHPPEADNDFQESHERLQTLMTQAPPPHPLFAVKAPKASAEYKLARFVKSQWELDASQERLTIFFTGELPGGDMQQEHWVLKASIATVHRVWKAMPSNARTQHPLTPIIKTWQRVQPKPVQPETRPDRFLPSKLGMTTKQDKGSRSLYSQAYHASTDGQQCLPGFGLNRDVSMINPYVGLWELDVSKTASGQQVHGRAAPLSQRVWFEAVLMVKYKDRQGNGSVVMNIPLREFMRRLFPTRLPRPNEYLPKLARAIDVLASCKARMPCLNPYTGTPELRSVVAIEAIPSTPDGFVRIYGCTCPTVLTRGGIVSPQLNLWGCRSAMAYRTLINLAFHWFQPNKNRIFVPDNGGWRQSDDPKDYEQLTDAKLIDLTNPVSAIKERRRVIEEAHKIISELENGGEVRVIEGRLLPPRNPIYYPHLFNKPKGSE